MDLWDKNTNLAVECLLGLSRVVIHDKTKKIQTANQIDKTPVLKEKLNTPPNNYDHLYMVNQILKDLSSYHQELPDERPLDLSPRRPICSSPQSSGLSSNEESSPVVANERKRKQRTPVTSRTSKRQKASVIRPHFIDCVTRSQGTKVSADFLNLL